ncbi:hypothetical protein, partial [Ligilactobacillus ruminis]|uniref:hypothetical protein n=1 Tax=Ligilactobacillus ruminis TaxID=1623 RepID=UPI0019D39BA4
FQNFGYFVLPSMPRALNLDQPVDKNHTFTPFFVYSRDQIRRAHTKSESASSKSALISVFL